MSDADKQDRINFLRLLLIIGLVFLHYGTYPGTQNSPYAGAIDFNLSTIPVAEFVNRYFVFLFYSAVPLLGAISGYLFFKDVAASPGFFLKRIRSRTVSILLPMISWSAIVLILFMAIRSVSPDSVHLSMIDYDLERLNFSQLLNALVGITRRPINFQFWFLHDLYLTVLISPILYVLLRKVPFVGLVTIGIIWLANYDVAIFFRNDVLFFFYLGGLVRLCGWNLDFLSPKASLLAMAAYLVLVGLRTVAPSYIPEDTLLGEFITGPGTRSLRLLGVVAFWGCAPFLMRTSIGRQITAWGALAFFLHSIHWPLNQFVKAGLAGILPVEGEVGLLVNYLLTVAATLVAAFIIAWALNAVAPSLFSHLSGGRPFGRSKRKADSPLATPSPKTTLLGP